MPAEISTPSSFPLAPATRLGRICLLADDLTGACDASAAFLAMGRTVRVWLDGNPSLVANESVQAFNTASRALPAEQASEAVERAAGGIEIDADTLIFKKIDSAARGPIAAELLAAHKRLGTRAIVFAPGFPAMGRTVRDGVLEARDASGQDSKVALGDLFPAEMNRAIALVRTGDELAAALDSGHTILMCDSATQEDLNALARAALPFAGLLYAGSAGLAHAIASQGEAHAPPEPLPTSLRTLVIAGTPHPVTALQLERLANAAHLSKHMHLLRIECKNEDGAEIRAVFRAYEPDALVLTGGDTALFSAKTLGAHSILLKGEFTAGIPWGMIQGGEAQDRIVVTKSGGFGSPSALYDLIEHFAGAA